MTAAVPSVEPHRTPTWRVVVSWLLPVVLLAGAFVVGYHAGRRGQAATVPVSPLTQPHEPGLLPPHGGAM